jgi:DNA-binding MarR family transcriptional regulator
MTEHDRPGFELPLLLVGAFRVLIDDLHAELAEQGHPEARPLHGFALQAVGPDGVSITELGRRLGVTKQAAAKTAANMERLGYVEREADPSDGRAWRLQRTARGDEMLELSAVGFDRLRAEWVTALGAGRVRALEADLATMIAAGGGAKLGDLPGWLHEPASRP